MTTNSIHVVGHVSAATDSFQLMTTLYTTANTPSCKTAGIVRSKEEKKEKLLKEIIRGEKK